jgi:hypothetical protein
MVERMLTAARRGAYAAAVALALGFGARAAVASPVALQTCTDPTAQGTCTSTSDCRKICNRLSNGLIPVCDTRTFCCTCQKL